MLDAAAYLERARLPRPDVTIAMAAAVLQTWYGLAGAVIELGSQQDRNFRIDTGTHRYVLKICRAEYASIELEAQNAAMVHLALKPGAPRVPKIIVNKKGDDIFPVDIGGFTYKVRLLEYLDGEQLTRQKHLPPKTIAALGRLAGQLAGSLADFKHPGLERDLQWDLRKADSVIADQLASVTDSAIRGQVENAAAMALAAIAPFKSELRTQPVHHDVTDDNVVSRREASGTLVPDGVIDFGDIMNGWLAAELASTAAALLHHVHGDPFKILPAIAAFHEIHPLNIAEIAALWPLTVLRAAALVASGEHQLAIDPDNTYVRENLEHERLILDVAASLPMALMRAAIEDALGIRRQAGVGQFSRLFQDLHGHQVRLVDLAVLSGDFADGGWMDEGITSRKLGAAGGETGFAATRYGEYRLTETRLHCAEESATFALHVDLWFADNTNITAPFAGVIAQYQDRVVLHGDALTLHLDGLRLGQGGSHSVQAGNSIGTAQRLRVQLCTEPDIVPPLFAKPSHAQAWSVICPSPSALLGFDCGAEMPNSAALLARRQNVFARPQKNYYENPPQIERGYRQHLIDVTGRAYLDMLNNVSILGHGHPRLAKAVERQWSLLNTNSRFHYAAVTEFSERLARLAPEGLDTVFLVNSGSEANDLALRLAWAHTGAKNMLCLLEAYHGWTMGSDAVSTSIADNPQALTTRPPWVHAVVSPNTYRGLYRGPGSTADYVQTVIPVLEMLDRQGEKLAGIIAEPVYGNAGGIALPPGYLREVYAMVRARGGLCIADEVQVGYGRLGHYFWGFEEQGVVPDIIAIAKGMGNGHPLGAVITTRAIAESLEKEGYFFSSAGGSPVSCVVGNTVLDIMAEERLQENARLVGTHLKTRLESLGQRFALVGAVHGMGLYLGLEFVRDRTTLAPATEETAGICNRLMELGVIMQPTGDYLNVLKIKPPMCLSIESADFFVNMLTRVLEEGW